MKISPERMAMVTQAIRRGAEIDDAIDREDWDAIPKVTTVPDATSEWVRDAESPVAEDCINEVMAYRKAKALLRMQRGGLTPSEIATVFDADVRTNLWREPA